jgi:hypothetical protein
MMSTVTAWAPTHAMNRAGRTWMSSVSSSMNATAVRGDRIVPPMIAAMLSMAHSPVSPA